MTRKDYDLISDALYRSDLDIQYYNASHTTPKLMHSHLCYAVCDALQSNNPEFARQRFLTACGVN